MRHDPNTKKSPTVTGCILGLALFAGCVSNRSHDEELIARRFKEKNVAGCYIDVEVNNDGTHDIRVGGGKTCPPIDFTPLEGKKIHKLTMICVGKCNLDVLSNAGIESLVICTSLATSTNGINFLPLRELYIEKAPISDLSPIKQLPLNFLELGETQVTDITPLASMKLECFWPDVFYGHIPHGLEVLKSMTTLTNICESSPSEFWIRLDQKINTIVITNAEKGSVTYTPGRRKEPGETLDVRAK
jgi:hypothetical protein